MSATNQKTGSFAPELRIGKELSDVPFLVLEELLAEGLAWHESLQQGQPAAAAAPFSRGPPGPKRAKLREREPW